MTAETIVGHADTPATRAQRVRDELLQQSGELACLVRMARDLAVTAEDSGDSGAAWRLRALLGATLQAADALHDAMGNAGAAA